MAKQVKKSDANDFFALEPLAHGITLDKLRPLTPEQRRRWEAAKRGRPRNAPPRMSKLDG